MNEKTAWMDDWKITSKIDTALLVLNSIMVGANIAQGKWVWVAVFGACVTFLAAKLTSETDSLIDLGKAGINLKNTIEEKMKKNE